MLTILSTGCVNPYYNGSKQPYTPTYGPEPTPEPVLTPSVVTLRPENSAGIVKVNMPAHEAREQIISLRDKRLCDEGRLFVSNVLNTNYSKNAFLFYDSSTTAAAMEILACAGDEQGFGMVANITAHNDHLISAMKEAARVNFSALHSLYVCMYKTSQYNIRNCTKQVQYLHNSIGDMADIWMPTG